MELYADVVVDISHEKVDRSFQYRIPGHLQEKLKTGMMVRIPFGKGNREITGYVTGIRSKADYDVNRMKEILSIEADRVTVESKMIALADWIRCQYGSTMNQALKTVLPVKAKVREKNCKTISLKASPKQAQEYLEEAKRKNYKARVRLLTALMETETRTLDCRRAAKELQVTGAALTPLVRLGIIEVKQNRIVRGMPELPGKSGQAGRQKPGEEQQRVIEEIRREFAGRNRPCLLHGVTGSGKTLVYMELIRGILKEGRQVIVLIPEIALTYQTVRRFYDYFGNRVAVLHSRLSQGERFDQMEQARKGELQVMIGPRSALFTPFPDLGMIIIDEEHERTYKSETMPRYHAREVAIQRAAMEHAHVLLGSATPSVDSYYQAQNGNYALFTLHTRFADRALPGVQVVDLREELKTGNRSMISETLRAAIADRLEKQEQVMLFLNRRGYAGFVSCRSCGYVAKCPHCDVSMSLHNYGRLVCHYCGYETKAYGQCPSCGSPYIGGFKAGTQQIEKTVQKMFPQSRVLRMDFDTTRKKDSYTQILQTFARKEADILIGTQMIVKGHDFPDVTLVGILAADLSLNESDYRSGERTFQLLVQAVGRAGRGSVPGEAFIQTYQPEHYSICGAVTQDYEAFYREEIAYRKMLGYPPESEMMAVYGGSENEELLGQGMNYLREFVLRIDSHRQIQMIGPAPMAVGKVQDVYRQVIYLKHKNRNLLTAVKDRMEEYIEANRGFQNINIQFDFHV